MTAGPRGPHQGQLVLSLFPGIGLLDMAFEEEGFCVLRGPDLLWGGDIRRFHPPAGKFDGVIGGPPCQAFGHLGSVNRSRWGMDSVLPNLIPEFERCVIEAEPIWFLMENVLSAPSPAPRRPDTEPSTLDATVLVAAPAGGRTSTVLFAAWAGESTSAVPTAGPAGRSTSAEDEGVPRG